jgi:hypothetical protein
LRENGGAHGRVLAGAAIREVSSFWSSSVDEQGFCRRANHDISARTIAAAALIESLAVHIAGMPYIWVIFHPSMLWKIPPELWRLVSSFLLTGPQLGLILDPYFGK